MTADVTHAAVDRSAARKGKALLRALRAGYPYDAAALMIMLAQAVWVAILAGRGWFYQDDFTFLAQAVHRPLNWTYLSEPVNSHLTPGLRLQFWLMQHFAPFSLATSVTVRVALQLIATWLLMRLLHVLVGRRPGVLVITAIYVLCPLLVPGTLWYAASTNLLPAQIFVITAVLWHVQYTVSGRLRYAAASGLALLFVVACWEKSATIALTLPIISLGFVRSGRVGERIRSSARDWLGWTLTAGPLVLFAIYFIANGYGSGGKTPSIWTAARLTWLEWLHSIAPSMVGGPWTWFSGRYVYESFSDTPTVLVVIAQLAFLILVGVGVRRCGPRSLVAWLIPATTIGVGMGLVAAGRYQLFGALLDRAYTYAFDSAVPLAIATALALLPSSPELIRERCAGNNTVQSTSRMGGIARWWLVAAALATCVVVTGSLVSGIRYGRRWAENPSGTWTHAVLHNVRARGHAVNLYNTGAPVTILPIISEARHISDIVGIAGVPATFNSVATEPEIVREDGSIVAAVLLEVAHARTSGSNPLCNDLVSGVATKTQPLLGAAAENEWFLRMEYFQRRPSVIYVYLVDARGERVAPVGGARRVLDGMLGAQIIQFPFVKPRQLVIVSDSPATNVCVTRAIIGYPFPRRPR